MNRRVTRKREPLPLNHAFGLALRTVRVASNVPQTKTSGRTYVSAIERGLKVPTLTKVDGLAAEFDVHPLTLLALAYSPTATPEGLRRVFDRVMEEVERLQVRKFENENLPKGAKPHAG